MRSAVSQLGKQTNLIGTINNNSKTTQNMKKVILSIATMLSINAFAQKIEKIGGNEVFTMPYKNGIGAMKTLKFNFVTPIDSLKESDAYKEFVANPDNFVKTPQKQDSVAAMCKSLISVGMFSIELKLKNMTSLDFPDGAVGSILIMKNELWATHPISAANGYGNTIISKAFMSKNNSFISK